MTLKREIENIKVDLDLRLLSVVSLHTAGLYIHKYKQSSVAFWEGYGGPSGCMQRTAEGCVVSSTLPSGHDLIGLGRKNRLSLIGGCAYGIP